MRYLICTVAVALIVAVGCKKAAGRKVKQSTKKDDATATSTHHAKVAEILEGDLIDSDGKSIDVAGITSKKYLLVYYSAHWCPPCRGFTPKLVNWYNKNHADYEVVFVSSDRSEGKMLSYMKETKMPWAAAKYRSSAHKKMAQFRKGGGIPCLVLLDSDDKRVAGSYTADGKKHLGPDNAYDKLKSLLDL